MHAVMIATLGIMLMLATPATGQDAANGARLGQRWCSSCHATATSGSDSAPPFREIANRPGRDAAHFRRFLGNPHPPMPPLQLSSSEIEDLVAFLVALRQP